MTDRADVHQARVWATAASKKRERLSATELRERILATAVEMLTKSGGLTVSLAHLNMEELIRIADVPRSSVYRAWENREAFYVDLMERMIQPPEEQGGVYDFESLQVGAKMVTDNADRLRTADGRRGLLRELIRHGVARNFESVPQSLAWRSSSALTATLPALNDNDQERILTALRKSEARFIDGMSDYYRAMMPIFGVRLKPGFDIKVFTATASAVVEGLIARNLTNPALVNTPVIQPAFDGQPAEWRLAAAGFMAIVDAMFEPDPDFDPDSEELRSALELLAQIAATPETPGDGTTGDGTTGDGATGDGPTGDGATQ